MRLHCDRCEVILDVVDTSDPAGTRPLTTAEFHAEFPEPDETWAPLGCPYCPGVLAPALPLDSERPGL